MTCWVVESLFVDLCIIDWILFEKVFIESSHWVVNLKSCWLDHLACCFNSDFVIDIDDQFHSEVDLHLQIFIFRLLFRYLRTIIDDHEWTTAGCYIWTPLSSFILLFLLLLLLLLFSFVDQYPTPEHINSYTSFVLSACLWVSCIFWMEYVWMYIVEGNEDCGVEIAKEDETTQDIEVSVACADVEMMK